MKKLNVAILTGGNVAERSISLKSAKTIEKHLNPERFTNRVIELNGKDFVDQQSGVILDKNDFSMQLAGEHITFDYVFLMLHGQPAEDGAIVGYFDLLGIPYNGNNHFVSALTFNKQACKEYLRPHGYAMAPSVLLQKSRAIDWEALKAMKLPVFVKPNNNGSSYGISKVDKYEDFEQAIAKGFEFDTELVVEGYLKGREFSIGTVRADGEIVVMPVTEIIPHNDYFDFDAKYKNQSDEVTPADITEAERKEVQAICASMYQTLGCKGLARFDFIQDDGAFNFLEVNTIPGFSEQSLFPQQAQEHGWSITKLLDYVIDDSKIS